MKKAIFCWLALLSTGVIYAQDNSENLSPKPQNDNIDALLPKFCIDVNLKGGTNMQNPAFNNFLTGYTNLLNPSVSTPAYSAGSSLGFDLQGGYFIGKKRNWGIGTGLLYMSQSGTLTMDKYHLEYQSTDFHSNVFRQLITASQPVKEKITSTNINIPLVIKYKHQLGRKFGVTVDAGIVYNVQMQNKYTTDASFDYEAVYKYSAEDGKFVYENNSTYGSTDILFTKTNTHGDPTQHLDSLRAIGFNVGLGKKPNATSGTVSYTSGSIGILLKPSLTYRVSRSVYLDLGLYYMSQTFNNKPNNLPLTDKVGNYNSLMNAETKVTQSSYGLNLGARFYFYNKKADRDGDGVADKKDKCPDVFGLAQFEGCPDVDADGIPDKNDSCPTVFGLALLNGCPDKDGDGIADKDDRCPDIAGPSKYSGCPDVDGDGIPDIDDKCPKVAGIAMYFGCPDTDGDGIPDNEDECPAVAGPKANRGCPLPKVEETKAEEMVVKPMTETIKQDINRIDITSPILFDLNKYVVKESSKPILNEAAKEMKANKDAYILIDAYTDATGSDSYNNQLSIKRANAVKAYLAKLGVNGKRVKTKGHGKQDPIAPNDTPEGREKNRRSVLKLDHK